jgi:hypothetical protein
MDRIIAIVYLSGAIGLAACSNSPVSWRPHAITDTSSVVITCDASKGNRGLYGYKNDVFVHIGLVTDLSSTPDGWVHVMFTWGSSGQSAKMYPSGDNKWSYRIDNIRKFFEVPDDEKILKIAVLFRSANLKDSCYALRNADGGNTYIPVNDVHVP